MTDKTKALGQMWRDRAIAPLSPTTPASALARLIADVVGKERNACALVSYDSDDYIMAQNAIRARKETTHD